MKFDGANVSPLELSLLGASDLESEKSINRAFSWSDNDRKSMNRL